MILFRPVGLRELELIAASGWTEFPPRLAHQPIFYPVLTERYAEAIARNWNTRDKNSGFAGFVTRFEIEDQFASRYPVQLAGSKEDQELWIPAEEVCEFNRHIRGSIEVVAAFYGDDFADAIDSTTNLPSSVR